MFNKEDPSQKILLICESNEEELHSMSNLEEENFRSFRALKESSNIGNKRTIQSQSSKPKPLIQRVPPTLITENRDFKKIFKPRVVAIGPLHHGKSRLQPAEKIKLKLAVLFTQEHGVKEQVLYKKIKEVGDLRKCYSSGDIEGYADEELAWMFFVDGCAVLHAIDYAKEEKWKKLNIKVDLVFAQVDLFMLENQIPFRVLDLLMNSVGKGKELRDSINEFINERIKKTIARGKEQAAQPPPGDQEHIHHLLGLLREKLLANHKPTNEANVQKSPTNKGNSILGELLMSLSRKSEKPYKTFRSISELKEAGIRVAPSETSSLQVDFSVGFLGTLTIPRMVVDDSTGSKFMNLVAYEMCPDFPNDFEVTSYLCFLDSLIDTAQDVKELRHAGMLLNHMGSDEEVADLFNTITTNLVPDLGIYQNVTRDICNYCDNKWTTSVAKLYYTHFSTPWSITAFLGALIGLIFTAIQAYYSMQRKISK